MSRPDSVDPSAVLDLFDALLDADEHTVRERLAQVPPAVAARVRTLLDLDATSDGVDRVQVMDAMAVGLDASAEPEPEAHRPSFQPVGFDIVERIGRGSMGEVYRAVQRVPRREVALKIVDGDGAAEAQALADARHPSIPEVYLVETGGDVAFVAMELVHGVPLGRWAGEVSLDERLAAFVALCEGVHQVHGQGVLHRDLKPANVLVDASGPRIVDFGLAAPMQQARGEVVGTLSHMADEILRGEPASVASDVFSLTCILVLLVTGESAMPVGTSSPRQQAEARGERTLPPLPPVFASIVGVGLDPEPQRRFSTARELGAEVERARRGHFPRVHRPSLSERVGHGARRFAIPLGIAAVVGVGVGLVVARDRLRENRAAAALERLVEVGGGAEESEGAERLERFIALPDVAGTVAQERARLRLAALFRARGDFDAAQEQWARVFAGEGVLRTEAADALADEFVRTRRWASADAVVPYVSMERQARLRSTAAVGLRDWNRPGVALPAIFTHLRDATRTERQAHLVASDGIWSYAWQRGMDVDRWSIRGEPQSEVLAWPAWWGRQAQQVDLDGALFVVDPPDRDELLLRRPRAGGWDEVATVPLQATLHATAAGDPNQDGVPSLFVGTAPDGRLLRVLEPPDWTPQVASPMIDAGQSDVGPIRIADLDGDGTPEVAVGLGAWRAHDLRLFHQEPDATLTFLTRLRFGGAQHTGVLPLPDGRNRLVSLKADVYPNPALFGEQTPYGRTAGLYVLAYDGTELTIDTHRPIDDLALPWAGILVGDLDGDGDHDVVGGGHQDTVIVEMDAEGGVVEVHRVQGMRALAVVDVDEDPADELYAVFDDDPTLWVLGQGDTPIPSARAPMQAGTELEALGLQGPAARIWRGRAEVAEDPDVAAAHYLRASELFEAAGDPRESLAMVDAALERSDAPEALARKGRLLARLARMAELAALPEQARPRPGAIDVLRLGFEEELPASSWERPTVVRHQPGVGLRIEGSPGDGVLFSLPLRRTGAWVGIEASLDVLAAEAGAELQVVLVGDDGRVAGVELHPWGGARQVIRGMKCTLGEGSRDLALHQPRLGSVDRRGPATMRVAVGPEAVHCGLDEDGNHQALHRGDGVELPEELTLQVRLRGPEPSARLDAVLREIVLTGLAAGTLVEDAGLRGLVRGELAIDPPAWLDPLEQLEVRARLGKVVTAAQVSRVLATVDRDRMLASLRRHPDFWLDALRQHAPEELGSWVPDGFYIALASGPSAAVDRHLDLAWLDGIGFGGRSVEYLMARAEALLRRGESDRARRIYERLDREVPSARPRALLGLTRVAARRGLEEEARTFCARARQARSGFLFDDIVAADPRIRPFCPKP